MHEMTTVYMYMYMYMYVSCGTAPSSSTKTMLCFANPPPHQYSECIITLLCTHVHTALICLTLIFLSPGSLSAVVITDILSTAISNDLRADLQV